MTTRTGPFADQLRFEAWLCEQIERLDGIGELARGVVDGRYGMARTDELWIEIDKRRARQEFDAMERGDGDTAVDADDVEATKGASCPS